MRRQFLFLLLASGILCYGTPVVAAGTLLTETLESDALGRSVSFYVYLPDGYDPADATGYPTIYFLHGGYTTASQYLNATTALGTAIAGGMEPALMVLPEGGYLSYFANSEVIGLYEDNLMDEIIPYVESNFNVRASGDSRAIMGHSMGGTAAYRLALTHPGYFVAMASHGATLSLRMMLEIMGPLVDLETRMGGISMTNGPWSEFLVRASRVFSPTRDNSLLCNPALDADGEIVDSEWQLWTTFDPLTIVETQGDLGGTRAYMDAGTLDMWLPTSLVMDALLTSLSIDHLNRTYVGDHNQLAAQYPYSLDFIDSAFRNEPMSVEQGVQDITPQGWRIVSAYPNPFNSRCLVQVEFDVPGEMTMLVYNSLGRQVRSQVLGRLGAGTHELTFDAGSLASGVYTLRIINQSRGEIVRRVTLVR